MRFSLSSVLLALGTLLIVPLTYASFFLYSPFSLDHVYFEGPSGTTIEVPIHLKNDFDLDTIFQLDPVDKTTTSQGDFTLESIDRSRDEFGKWAHFETSEVTIPANSVKELTLIIDIPSDLPIGEYWGGIWARSIKNLPDPTAVDTANGAAIKLQQGLRARLTVVDPASYTGNATVTLSPEATTKDIENPNTFAKWQYYLASLFVVVFTAALITFLRKRMTGKKA
jgi:hypothetical protein